MLENAKRWPLMASFWIRVVGKKARKLAITIDVDIVFLFTALLFFLSGPGFRLMVDTFLAVILLSGLTMLLFD